MLLGIPLRRPGRFRLRDSHPLWCALPRASTNPRLSHSLPDRQIQPSGPTTPITKRLPAITRDRFSLFRFRSPLLSESRLLSLPVGNEMFHFPTFPPRTLYIQVRVTGHDSCRVSPFGNPRITARLTAPRGLSQPPTSFIGSWCQDIHRVPLLTWPQRCSRPLCSSQGAGGHPAQTRRLPRAARRYDVNRSQSATKPPSCQSKPGAEPQSPLRVTRTHPVPQDPTACQTPGHPTSSSRLPEGSCTRRGHAASGQLVSVPPLSSTSARTSERGSGPASKLAGQVLLRKEVIQPHLPVRLPCYDFVLIADPTFDSSLLAVGPLASGVTDFHDVTGGVYKARERIHRSVADLRLLATPTSWGRVADPNPN